MSLLLKHRSFRVRTIAVAVVVALVWPALAISVHAAMATWLAPSPSERITSRNVEVSVGYNTQSDLKVTRLELWIDGRYYATRSLIRPESRGVCSFWWDTAKFATGSHQLYVRVYAGDQLVAKVSSTVIIGQKNFDLRVPNVRFANIKSGDVLKGVVPIKMVVTDDSAEPPIVSLLIDGGMKYLSNRQPYVCSLDTTKYPDGEHELQTYAYDSAGNKSDPAVVKVFFKNGIELPAVVSASSESKPVSVAHSEDDGVGQLLAPPEESRVNAPAVGRTIDLEPRAALSTSTSLARPIAQEPKQGFTATRPSVVQSVTANPDTATTTNVRLSQPQSGHEPQVALRSEPEVSDHKVSNTIILPGPRIDVACPEFKARSSSVEPSVERHPASASAGKSSIGSNPAVSAPKIRVSVSDAQVKVVQTRPSLMTRLVTPAGPVFDKEEATVVDTYGKADIVEPGRFSAHIDPQPRKSGGSSTYIIALNQAVPSYDLVESLPSRQRVVNTIPEMRTNQLDSLTVISPRPTVPGFTFVEAESSLPTRSVAVALLPTVRERERVSSTIPRLAQPSFLAEDRKAKLEKRVIKSKGAVRLRDLVESLGGVVFWDHITRTATAYLGNMRIEVRIGSRMVRVNGQIMRTNFVPRILNGRTIVDSGLYVQACALVPAEAASKK
ncbi:MAG: stalk domain-containing protein [Armatimonadota bacterium]